MNTTIEKITAREIIDSRGNPTIEVEVRLKSGIRARAASPSGASTGIHEAVELRDGTANRYNGKGVLKAVHFAKHDLGPKLEGMAAEEQAAIDSAMIDLDGTPNKGKFGANTTLAISMAVARAASSAMELSLWDYLGTPGKAVMPVPMMNILNGGVHANWQGPDFQEYMIVPHGAPTFAESLRYGCEVYHALKGILKKKGYSTGVRDEGGFAPTVASNREPLDLIMEAINEAGYSPGNEISIALDPASSGFYSEGFYDLRTEKKRLDSSAMVEYYHSLIRNYPVIAIEDGLAEDDWDGWKILNKRIGSLIELVGDDLFVTNVKRIQRGIDEDVANAVLIKLNQIGTVTETIAAVRLAKSRGCWGSMVSHRSGETVDSFIADFTVAMGTGHLKTGAPCRGERVEKYNQLLRIEEEMGSRARFAGRNAFVR